MALDVVVDSLLRRGELCNSGLPDPEMCTIPEAEQAPPPQVAVLEEAAARSRWLLGLLVFQSTSSMVLDRYQDLLRDHIVVTLFLTMLVGAGGNAGEWGFPPCLDRLIMCVPLEPNVAGLAGVAL